VRAIARRRPRKRGQSRLVRTDTRYVLYSGRHTFGTNVYSQTGNLKLIMAVMGHKDVQTAMRYQHPETELVREVIDRRNGHLDYAKKKGHARALRHKSRHSRCGRFPKSLKNLAAPQGFEPRYADPEFVRLRNHG
jgi:integrase